MLLTPNFVKALKGLFAMLIGFYLITLVLQFSGNYGLSGNEPNSFFRIFINQFYQYLVTMAFWLTVYFITRDKRAFQAVMILQTIVFLYAAYSFSGSTDVKGVINSLMLFRRGVDFMSYILFGLLHFRSARGLYILFAWLIIYGITSGPWFTNAISSVQNLMNLMDLDRMFVLRIDGEDGVRKYVDFLRPVYTQSYILFDLIIFWFVYSLIKAGKSFDLTLRTIQLHPVIKQLTFSLIYWPLRIMLVIAAFGIMSLVGVSFYRGLTLMTMFQIGAACFSIFVVGSIYRNVLTDYLISRGRSPGWLYWLLNIPILNFFAWLYTFFIPDTTTTYNEVITPTLNDQNQLASDEGLASVSHEPDIQEEPSLDVEAAPVYEGPPVYHAHPLQTDFTDEGRNTKIKVIMIMFSITMIVVQLSNTNVGFLSSSSRQTESPFVLLLITLAFTIWYMFDWKAFLPLFFLQCVGILSIAFFQLKGTLTPAVGAGFLNIILYYSLFHFDYLKLIEAPVDDFEPTPGQIPDRSL